MTSEQQRLSEIREKDLDQLDNEVQSIANQFYDVVPDGWGFGKLDNLIDQFIDYRGKTPPKAEEGIHMLSAANIKDGFILPERKEKFVSTETFEEWTTRGLPEKGDVVITTEAPVGEVGIIRSDEQFLTAQRLITLRTGEELDSRYLKFCLQYHKTQNQLESYASGTTVSSFNQTDLRNTVIPLPPLSEQEKIGEILDDIERKITVNKRSNQLLGEIARSIFEFRFVDFKPYEEFKHSEKGDIPSKFKVENLPALMNIVLGGTPTSDVEDYYGGDILWAKAKDVSQEDEIFISSTEKTITEIGLEESSAELIPEGTTVITARGTVGETALTPTEMTTNQTCYGLVPKNEEDKYFLYFLVQSHIQRLRSRTHGTVFDTINMSTLREQEIVLPPEEERFEFNSDVGPIMDLIRENQKENKILHQLRNTTLPKLMSGEVRVNDINLEDLEVSSEV